MAIKHKNVLKANSKKFLEKKAKEKNWNAMISLHILFFLIQNVMTLL